MMDVAIGCTLGVELISEPCCSRSMHSQIAPFRSIPPRCASRPRTKRTLSLGDKGHPIISVIKSDFFVSQGFLFVSVNYRLAPQHKHPAQSQDAAAALAFLHDNVNDFGGEPSLTVLICAWDRNWMDLIDQSPRPVRTERPSTISTGGDCCRFRFIRDAQKSGKEPNDVVLVQLENARQSRTKE
jgi:hypothetical protein